jgi:hypothetical protein
MFDEGYGIGCNLVCQRSCSCRVSASAKQADTHHAAAFDDGGRAEALAAIDSGALTSSVGVWEAAEACEQSLDVMTDGKQEELMRSAKEALWLANIRNRNAPCPHH